MTSRIKRKKLEIKIGAQVYHLDHGSGIIISDKPYGGRLGVRFADNVVRYLLDDELKAERRMK